MSHNKNIHSLDGNSSAVLDDHLVDLGVAGEIQVGVDSASRMDVGMSAVAAAAGLDTNVSDSGLGQSAFGKALTSRLIHLSLDSRVRIS